ncbi:MAG TPA: hypothetical protein VNJ08_01410 [Bacteriovoracaceae bacterium]|nr:hypothetical protein [Bacteriovoracaceae bacterium]
MKHILLSAILLLSLPTVWASSTSVLEESLYHDFRQSIQQKSRKQLTGFTSFEQKIYVDALTDLLQENSVTALMSLKSLTTTLHFDLIQRVRLAILQKSFSRNLVREINNTLLYPNVDRNLLYTLAANETLLKSLGLRRMVWLARRHPQYHVAHSSGLETRDVVLRDLFYSSPSYAGVKVFMFCRQNRLYPCLMVMRDLNDEAVRNADGRLWTNKSLAVSAQGLPSNVRNGNTPAGVLVINSVMPVADQQVSFGKFRRIILDFVTRSPDENLIKSLLPASSHRQSWWKPNVVARDVGRNELRIHGTGKINVDPETPYYPFMPTSGCVAQRENTYDGITYQDQRDLLDSIMDALALAPTYENETQIKGLLYIVEIDNLELPVSKSDLAAKGIF